MPGIAQPPLTDLPHDMLLSTLRTAAAVDLGRMARCSRLWRRLVDEVAEQTLRARRPHLYPLGSDACPCWLRSLAAAMQVDAAVGPKPSRSWQDEYVSLMVAASRAFDPPDAFFPDLYEPSGALSLSKTLEQNVNDVAACTQAGWSADDAEVVNTIVGGAPAATMQRAWLARSSEFAATAHRLFETYSEAALRQWREGVAPKTLYAVLGAPLKSTFDEHEGLLAFDPAWAGLTTARIGDRIEMFGGAYALNALECYFPDEQGMHYSRFVDNESDAIEWQLQDSDIVCFTQPAPANRSGYHALVHQPGDPQSAHPSDQSSWVVPAPCTVTLEAVSEPGQWQVFGRWIRRRRYTVSIEYG